jgi:hypothetical protein
MKTMHKMLLGAALLSAAPAFATDFSYTGTFRQDDNVAFFDFVATGTSTVTLRSFSYAGGVNSAGATIAAGGFDPILTLYDLATGNRISFQDDGSGVPVDPVTGAPFDVNFSSTLAAGTYRVALSQYNNFGGATLSDAFGRAGSGNFTQAYCDMGITAPFCDFTGAKRTSAWAFDILGVDTAIGPGGTVPEPATWAMMILGMGAVGGALRRRSTKVTFAH